MRHAITLLVAALILGTTGSDACSVLQFHWSGLAAHISGLWDSLPALYGSNGSVFIDNAEFPYRCTEQGGWHDFFETDDGFLQPWTPALANSHQCQYYTYGEMARASELIGISHVQSRFDPGIVRKARPSLNVVEPRWVVLFNFASLLLRIIILLAAKGRHPDGAFLCRIELEAAAFHAEGGGRGAC